jgi:hypothetical protein
MNKFITFGVSILLSLTTGCSCFVPSHQTISVSVIEPPHAKILINGVYEGESAVQVSVIRNHTVGVIVKKEGFQTESKIVSYHLNTTGILDVVGTCLFLIPVIGLMTSGSHSLDDTTLVMQLAPEESQTTPANAPAVTTK